MDFVFLRLGYTYIVDNVDCAENILTKVAINYHKCGTIDIVTYRIAHICDIYTVSFQLVSCLILAIIYIFSAYIISITVYNMYICLLYIHLFVCIGSNYAQIMPIVLVRLVFFVAISSFNC